MPGPQYERMDKATLITQITKLAGYQYPWQYREEAIQAALDLSDLSEFRLSTTAVTQAALLIAGKLAVAMPAVPDNATLEGTPMVDLVALAISLDEALWDFEVRKRALHRSVGYWRKEANPASYPDKDTFTSMFVGQMNYIRAGRGLPPVA